MPSIRFNGFLNARLASLATDGGFARCITGSTRLRRWSKRRSVKRWSPSYSLYRENADRFAAFRWKLQRPGDSCPSVGWRGPTKHYLQTGIEKGISIMLVLTRKNQESVVVGGTNPLEQLLTVTVLEVRRGKVVLGIEGNRDVPVFRSEVWQRMCDEATTAIQV
jgi:carbon storage regulator CsrA